MLVPKKDGEFLGFINSSDGIKMNKAKVSAVLEGGRVGNSFIFPSLSSFFASDELREGHGYAEHWVLP